MVPNRAAHHIWITNTDKDTDSNKIYVLLDGVEGNAEDDIDELLSNSNIEFVLTIESRK